MFHKDDLCLSGKYNEYGYTIIVGLLLRINGKHNGCKLFPFVSETGGMIFVAFFISG